jgi:Transposase DDE domain
LKQGFELHRERCIKGKRTVEVVYGITSLSPEQADAAQLLALVRDHWKIENQLHYVRDVTLREDACRVRSGTAPQILAAIRNTVVHLLASVEAASCSEAIEQLQIHPDRAKKLIGIPQCE